MEPHPFMLARSRVTNKVMAVNRARSPGRRANMKPRHAAIQTRKAG